MSIDTKKKWHAIALISICQVLALSLWFSATAVVPILKATVGFGDFHASLFTSVVAIGFVFGTIISAAFGLADRVHPKIFFAISTAIAATANGLIIVFDPLSPLVILLRLVTGLCMAGIYPIGMKIIATWADKDAGLLVGILVGALTLGSASPHLLNLLGTSNIDWRIPIFSSSCLAAISAILICFSKLGKELPAAPRFNPSLALQAWKFKPLRLVNFGYFGHMFELYAMWAWIGVFLFESFRMSGQENPQIEANLATFATIGIGAIGSISAGVIADKVGRTTVTVLAMLTSGTCAVLVGFLFGSSPVLLIIVCLIWGISIVADSAQFSTCIIELSPANLIGTMLTIQTSVGFLISLVTIHLVPIFVGIVGWQYAFAPLAIGPFFGIVAMLRLRKLPIASKLANGQR